MVDEQYIKICEKERICPECKGNIKVKEYPDFVCVKCGYETNINFFDVNPEFEKIREERIIRQGLVEQIDNLEDRKKEITNKFLEFKQKNLKMVN